MNVTRFDENGNPLDTATGEPLVRREDDNPKVVRERLRTFHESTEPLVEYYRNKGVPVHVVDASLSVMEVQKQVTDILDSFYIRDSED